MVLRTTQVYFWPKWNMTNTEMRSISQHNFTLFPVAETFWNHPVSVDCQANRSKLSGNYAFPQNFHTRKLGEISAFYILLLVVFRVEHQF